MFHHVVWRKLFFPSSHLSWYGQYRTMFDQAMLANMDLRSRGSIFEGSPWTLGSEVTNIPVDLLKISPEDSQLPASYTGLFQAPWHSYIFHTCPLFLLPQANWNRSEPERYIALGTAWVVAPSCSKRERRIWEIAVCLSVLTWRLCAGNVLSVFLSLGGALEGNWRNDWG